MMERRRHIRLITLSNDAFALAAGNFNLPIYKWNAVSESTESVSSVKRNRTWMLKVRNVSQLIGLNLEKDYATLHERLSGLPKGYSWKIEFARCLFDDEAGELHFLDFYRDTIHKRWVTEPDYQDYIYEKVKKIWDVCKDYYTEFGIEIKEFRPSILVLEQIDGSDELASNFDFLLSIVRRLQSEKNPISKMMYEIVWRIETKRGTWEYVPFEGEAE